MRTDNRALVKGRRVLAEEPMCGIAGSLRFDSNPVDLSAIRAASEVIRHRGPDDHGYAGWAPGRNVRATRDIKELAGSSLVLAHRRLSILELSEAGWQPMSTLDGRHFIVFNGEIYNYVELGKQLESEGVSIASNSDTEVLLKGLVRWGRDLLPRLVGMFAFGYVDLDNERLLLVRDFFGIKPLYYTLSEDALHFCSEMKGLLQFPDVKRRVNAREFHSYLSGIVDASEDSFISSIRRVPPATCLEFSLRKSGPPQRHVYWRLPQAQPVDITFEEATARVREIFLENVDLHLRSDVPVGCALSGGIDSSAIAMAMRRLRGESLEIHAFSYVAESPAISEEKWIDLVAAKGRIITHKVTPTSREFIDDLDKYVYCNDEPFGWYNGYAQYRFFQRTNQTGIKVQLDGQGADEMFAGYSMFVHVRLESLLRRGRWAEGYHVYAGTFANPGDVSVSRYLRHAARVLAPGLATLLTGRGGQEKLAPPWIDASWFKARGIADAAPGKNIGERTCRQNIEESFRVTSLPRLLRCEDRTSMAHSVESRVPFLTPKLVELAFSLPESFLVDERGSTKAVLRAAMKGIVPQEVLDRRDKVAFYTSNWLEANRPAITRALEGDAIDRIPAFKKEFVRKYWNDLATGASANYRPFWRVFNTIRWAQVFDVSFD